MLKSQTNEKKKTPETLFISSHDEQTSNILGFEKEKKKGVCWIYTPKSGKSGKGGGASRSDALRFLLLPLAARRRLLASLGGVSDGARLLLAASSPKPQLPFLPPLLHLADVGGEQRLERRNQPGEGPNVAQANLRRQEGGQVT